MRTIKKGTCFVQLMYFFILGFILLFPKITLISVPGTYIGIRAEDFMIALFLCIVFVGGVRKRKEDRITNNASLKRISQVFSVFFALTIISTIFGALNGYISVMHGLLFCARNLEYFLFIIIGIMFGKKYGKEDKLFRFVVWCLLIHVAIAFLQYFGVLGAFKDGVVVNATRGGRVWSTFNGPYEFASFLTMIAPVCLYMFLEGKKVLFNGIAILAALSGVLLSQSRSSLVVLAVLIGWLIARDFLKMARYGKERKALARNVLLILCMAIVTVVLAQSGTILSRFSSIKTSDIVEDTKEAIEQTEFDRVANSENNTTSTAVSSTTGFSMQQSLSAIAYDAAITSQANGDMSYNIRIRKWVMLFDDFMKSPIIGCGPSTALEAADGNYVRLLAEGGVLGLTLWVVFIVTILKNLDKRKKMTYTMVLYGTVALLMTAIFIDIFIASKIMMFYYILVGYNISDGSKRGRIERHENEG